MLEWGMPKRSNAFQTLVAQIQHHFERYSDCNVEESRFLQNSETGKLREVDIVVEGILAGVPIVISFECTSSARKASSTWVENMIGKHRKLPTHHLILVSESGFYKPALKAADGEKDVDAVTFSEASEVDWAAYAETFSGLRFGGFELKAEGIETEWLRPLDVDASSPEHQINQDTVFRRLADGLEMTARAFAEDITKASQVGREVMNRYFADKRDKKHPSPDAEEALSYEATGTARWVLPPNTWAVVLAGELFAVCAVNIQLKVFIKDSPMPISYKSFMGAKVAHSTVDQPFMNLQKDKADEVSVAITQIGNEQPIASVSFTKSKPGIKKLSFAEFSDDPKKK